MSTYSVTFIPQNKSVRVEADTSLLEAALRAGITINNLCGGDGICARCKMIVTRGKVTGRVSPKLTRDEIRRGFVLACQTPVDDNLVVEIPEETWAKEKLVAAEDAARFRDLTEGWEYEKDLVPAPLVTKVYLEIEEPDLANNMADHQRVDDAIRKALKYRSMQMGLKILKNLPEILRQSDYKITATVGLRRDIAEVMNIEGGNTADRNFMAVVDMGTTTIVAHLVNTNTMETLDARACFNSQGIYGREVTRRMMTAEQKGVEELQRLLVEDINGLIEQLADANKVKLKDISAVVCSGNTAMGHFLLGLCTRNIRRNPYVATTVSPPPLRAVEVGLNINPRGLLYSLPAISGWVGSDITAGILSTRMNEREELSLLLDIGTNGEIVIGNREWLVSASASAGPALEGASVDCGMRAEAGAVEKIYVEDASVRYQTIDGKRPKGICGSGIIDAVAVLLDQGYINRSGVFLEEDKPRVEMVDGLKRYIIADGKETGSGHPVYISESDIENVITAKAAIFAAMKILLHRLDLTFEDVERFCIAGAFGSYINIEHAVAIGLIPDIERSRFEFVGNTSIKGAKIVAFYKEALYKIEKIREDTTYYDLMGANDYVEEFQKAMFLPHTDIELFHRNKSLA
ncbi:MAG: ASKHA domain-containing protein [Spirochaetia bacterium]